MNIANKLAQIFVALTKNGLVPALENVPDLALLPVIVLAVAGQHSLHDPADRFPLPFDQEMKVIRHQAVCIQIKWQLAFLYSEQ